MNDKDKKPGNPWTKSLLIWVGVLFALVLFVQLIDGGDYLRLVGLQAGPPAHVLQRVVVDQHQHLADNATFFSEALPGRDGALGSPGGAVNLGPLGVDTPLVSALPPRGS